MDAAFIPGRFVVRVVADPREIAAQVVDPEIPVLTIEDLGILRSVEVRDNTVLVTITPTYSGCPALGQISDDIVAALRREGYDDVVVDTDYSVSWSTDWLADEARAKLADFGIAPPGVEPVCPRCAGRNPSIVSEFGSTACKSLMACSSCGEPFDHFKDF